VTAAVTEAFHDTFRVGAGLAFLTLIAVLVLREVPLRTTVGHGADEGKRAPGASGAAGLAD
jgi:hypothetical protein